MHADPALAGEHQPPPDSHEPSASASLQPTSRSGGTPSVAPPAANAPSLSAHIQSLVKDPKRLYLISRLEALFQWGHRLIVVGGVGAAAGWLALYVTLYTGAIQNSYTGPDAAALNSLTAAGQQLFAQTHPSLVVPSSAKTVSIVAALLAVLCLILLKLFTHTNLFASREVRGHGSDARRESLGRKVGVAFLLFIASVALVLVSLNLTTALRHLANLMTYEANLCGSNCGVPVHDLVAFGAGWLAVILSVRVLLGALVDFGFLILQWRALRKL